MSTLTNKIDFVAVIAVTNANPNGDPLNGNSPRTDYDGFGEISDVCIKRKIRNRMQDMGKKVFVQSDDRCDDGCTSLSKRAEENGLKAIKDEKEFYQKVCQKWIDVRAFGQLFAFNALGIKSLGVRGPVSIHQAVSVSPVEVIDMQITKSVSGEKKDNDASRSSDTMGMKHFVKFGLYTVKGSVNVQLAEKTGFSEEDAEVLKESIRSLFVNDSSAARPDGSMEVVKVFWFNHNCKEGQYSSAKVHRSVKVGTKDGITVPSKIEDYDISLDKLPGLEVEELEGV